MRTLKERISRYLSSPLFPIEVSDLPARVTFLDAPDGPWEIDGLRVQAHPVSHPGTTLGYRVEADGAVARVHPRSRAGARPRAGVAHQRLDLGVPGGRRTRRSCSTTRSTRRTSTPQRIGWGHSSIRQTVTFAAKTGAESTLLFHHDPVHTDDDLEAHCERAQELWQGDGPPPELAREGMEIDL